MPFEQLLTKVIKRRKPDRGKSDGKGIDGKDAKKAESSSSEDEGESQKDWVVVRDPHGRLAWQHRKTGEVTYGNSYASHQAGYNPALAQEAFGKGGSDSESDSEKKANKPKPPPPPPVPVMAPVYPPGGMPFVPPPVGFMPSPVTYGPSPVAMYPVAPWNAMPVSPVPMHVPEYIKRQHAEAEKKKKEEEAKKKKKEEAERQKKIAEGTWERYYTDDGGVFYQHTVTGQKLSEDPYR